VLCSKLVEVCKALEALNTRLLRPRTATGGGQPPALLNEPSVALMTRLDAALIAIDAFGGIAAFLDVSKKDAARIARPALQLVFGACHAALVAATAGRQSAQRSELAGWLSGSFPAYASHCLEAGSSLVLKQFKTSEEGLVFGPTVAPADVLVPWLASVAGALLVCYPRPGVCGCAAGLRTPVCPAAAACLHRPQLSCACLPARASLLWEGRMACTVTHA
jgi:hypothetical protein